MFTLPAECGRFHGRFGFTKPEDGQWVSRAKDFTCDILEAAASLLHEVACGGGI